MRNLAPHAERAIAEGVFPGCVIGTLESGEKTVSSYGDVFPVYDVASITKSIPLASVVALFVAEGLLVLSDPVTQYVPELQHDFGATIEDLLRYRAQGTQMSSLHFSTFEEIRAHALERGFNAPPGESVYTNLPAFVLGIVVERVGQASLARLAHQYIFEPFGMDETTFFPSKQLCAPTEIVDGETVQGVPHDESARVFARARRTVGHAGLFSTASDLLQFAEFCIADPTSPIVQRAQAGLGWQVNDPRFMGVHAGPHTFGKTGFTGTSVMIDVERQLALVILSNRTYPKRPPDDEAIFAFRRAIADIVFAR